MRPGQFSVFRPESFVFRHPYGGHRPGRWGSFAAVRMTMPSPGRTAIPRLRVRSARN